MCSHGYGDFSDRRIVMNLNLPFWHRQCVLCVCVYFFLFQSIDNNLNIQKDTLEQIHPNRSVRCGELEL